MKRKKQFVSPRVLNQVEVCLERDLLGASLTEYNRIISAGQPVNEYDFTPADAGDPANPYTVEWD